VSEPIVAESIPSPAPRRYHEALSEPRRPWWIAALALATFAGSIVLVSVLLSFAAIEVDLLLGDQPALRRV
jgi:hypothetical protein